jgi:hypothetical protein
MPTCKAIYEIGTPLIEDHNFCKSWPRLRSVIGHPPELSFRGVFTLLLRLLELPPKRQWWTLRYVKNVGWHGGIFQMPQEITPMEILNRVKSEAPWLFQTVTHLNASLTNIDVSHNGFLLSQNDDRNDDRNDGSEAGEARPQWFPGIIGLLLFSNLKCLTIDCIYCPEIPAIIDKHRGDVYFQQLQVLHIKRASSDTLRDLMPFLLLPKLKSLIMDALDGYIRSENGNSIVWPNWPYGDRKSKLEHVTFFKANADINCVMDILSHLLSLRTFVWENNPQFWYPEEWGIDEYYQSGLEDDSNYQGEVDSTEAMEEEPGHEVAISSQRIDEGEPGFEQNAESTNQEENGTEGISVDDDLHKDWDPRIDEGDPDEDPHHPFWELFWMPLVDYDSEDDNDKENDDHPRLIEEWGWKPSEVPHFWNPTKFLNEALLPYKNSLEHLGMTISNKGKRSLIEKSDLILHFRDFTSLKYL